MFPDNHKPCKVARMTDQKIKKETGKGIWPIISELDIAAPNNTLENLDFYAWCFSNHLNCNLFVFQLDMII